MGAGIRLLTLSASLFFVYNITLKPEKEKITGVFKVAENVMFTFQSFCRFLAMLDSRMNRSSESDLFNKSLYNSGLSDSFTNQTESVLAFLQLS